jgi:plasmid stabilization system protein ParE
MAYQIKLTEPAEADAYAAYEYIQGFSPRSAEKWFRGLFEVIFSLREMPTRCPLIAESDEIGLPLRHHLYGRRTGTYRIIFDIQEQAEDGPTVRILRIWHAMRDALKAEDIEDRSIT